MATTDAGRAPATSEFAEVFDTRAPQVLRYVRRRIHDQDAAWDVVSDAFTTAWRHWDRRPSPDDMLPWLYAIAANAIRDQRRSAARRGRLAARLTAAHRSSHAPDPADEVVMSESVLTAMARLSAADQEVLRLVGWEQLTDAASISLVLGISPAAARVRVHRARSRLRALLGDPADPAGSGRSASARAQNPTILAAHATRKEA